MSKFRSNDKNVVNTCKWISLTPPGKAFQLSRQIVALHLNELSVVYWAAPTHWQIEMDFRPIRAKCQYTRELTHKKNKCWGFKPLLNRSSTREPQPKVDYYSESFLHTMYFSWHTLLLGCKSIYMSQFRSDFKKVIFCKWFGQVVALHLNKESVVNGCPAHRQIEIYFR